MEQSKRYSTWEEIDPEAIENNIQHVHNPPSVDVMAIVKANGSGHEALQTAGAAFRGNVVHR
jgi:alanine racemase